VGFSEGEGSFFISVNLQVYKGRHHVNFSIGFSVAQNEREILDRTRDFLGFGKVVKYGKQAGYQLRTRNFDDAAKVREFFLQNPLRSEKKKYAFSLWLKAFDLHQSRNHLNLQGILELCRIRDELHSVNAKRKNYLSYDKIKAFLESGEDRKIQHWTNKDIELLKSNFPEKTDKALASLTGHPIESVISKRIHMGLVRMKKRKWNKDELDYIRKMSQTMKDEEIGKALNRTEHSISWMRVKLGLKKSQANNSKGQFNWKIIKERKST
jgi:hypothetical protein